MTELPTKNKHRLKESAIVSLLIEIKVGRVNIDAHNRMNKKNPNYPSSLEFAKSLLYRANDALEIEIPQTEFQSSSEIYNYLFEFLGSYSEQKTSSLRDDLKTRLRQTAEHLTLPH